MSLFENYVSALTAVSTLTALEPQAGAAVEWLARLVAEKKAAGKAWEADLKARMPAMTAEQHEAALEEIKYCREQLDAYTRLANEKASRGKK